MLLVISFIPQNFNTDFFMIILLCLSFKFYKFIRCFFKIFFDHLFILHFTFFFDRMKH